MRASLWLGVAAILASAACSPQARTSPANLAAERTALMDTDRAWFESQGDSEAFAAFVANEAVWLPAGLPLVSGKERYLAVSSELFAAPGTRLTWQPSSAEVSESADLGYTIGSYELTANDSNGNPVTSLGKYLTVWRKETDGQWRVVADCFNGDAPPPGSYQDTATADTARARLGETQTAATLMKAGLDAFYARNDPTAAAATFREVLEQNPTHYGATYQLAAALDAAGKRDEARAFWEKMLPMAEAINDQATIDMARARLAATP